MKRKTGILLLMIAAIPGMVMARYTSRLEKFEVAEKKGCAPFTVNITIVPPNQCDASQNLPCEVDFGDGWSGSFIATHTYTQPGTYLLRVLIQEGEYDDIQIEVVPSTPPEFEIYSCGNNQVTVNVTDKEYDEYVITYDDGNVAVVTSSSPKHTHSFTSPGLRTITVRGRNKNAADNCNEASKQVNVLPSLPPASISQLQVLDDKSIQLNINSQPDILYRLEIKTNNTFQLLKNVYNSTSEIVSGLKTDNTYYCFRVSTFDPCNNSVSFPSNTICSVNFDLEVQNNVNNLTWNTDASVLTGYEIERTPPGTTILPITETSYPDTNITCGTAYCYRIIAHYPDGVQSISLQKCGTAISTDIPSPVEDISAIVNPNGVILQWQQVLDFTPAEFSVFTNSIIPDLVGKTNLLELADENYNIQNPVCYRISYQDVCGNSSPLSKEVCPIRLSGRLEKDNVIILSWTPFEGWKNDVESYTVEKYAESGAFIGSYNTGTSLSFTDTDEDPNNQVFRYVVRATAKDVGFPPAVSNEIILIKEPRLFSPTAFTPNNDGLNDIFVVFGQYIQDFEMDIFNRWGELVFHTDDPQKGWDGNFKGNPMPEGTYTFVAQITDLAGRTLKRSGTVVLLRKNK